MFLRVCRPISNKVVAILSTPSFIGILAKENALIDKAQAIHPYCEVVMFKDIKQAKFYAS